MATDVGEKPEGSIIREREESDGGLTLFWKPPGKRLSRLGQGLFILFWLGGWAAGEVFAAMSLIAMFGGGDPGNDRPLFAMVFMLAWLGAWTVGGVFAMFAAWSLLRPLQAERITLTRNTFRHHPGTPDPTANRSGREDADGDLSDQIIGRGSGRVAELTPEQMTDLVLERVGERQRIRYDFGRERREIGRALSEPEREWLYDILLGWRDGRG